MRGLSRLAVAAVIVAAFVGTPVAQARGQSDSPDRTAMDVATKPLDPFVIFDETAEGGVRGFSVDVWTEIADRLDFDTTWVRRDTVGEIIELARSHEVDASIAGISMTRDREEIIDFSHPYFDSGLQIVTSSSGEEASVFGTVLGLITSRRFLAPLLVLLGLIALISHLIWWGERRHNPEFPQTYRKGIGEALWWSSVSVVTGGEAVKDIRRPLSRIMALLWMVVGLFLVAFVTAQAASSLTVSRLEGSISGLRDLPGKSVVTVENTVAASFLHNESIPFATVADVDAALDAVEAGKYDAFVFDAPVLAFRVATDFRGRLSLTGSVFAPDPYGIALPPGSELRESINATILELASDGTLDEINQRWFHQDR